MYPIRSDSTVRRKIALIAHDNQKLELLEWARWNRDLLAGHELFATGTTGRLLETELDLNVECFQSGPLGGDQQIGSRIADTTAPFTAAASAPGASSARKISMSWCPSRPTTT